MSIAALLARAKAAAAPPIVIADIKPTMLTLTKRVRAVDLSGAVGFFVEKLPDGWIFWLDDDGSSHLSHPDHLEEFSQ